MTAKNGRTQKLENVFLRGLWRTFFLVDFPSSYNNTILAMTPSYATIPSYAPVVLGGHVKFIVLPDNLKNAPMFKKVQSMKRDRPGTPNCTSSCTFSYFLIFDPFMCSHFHVCILPVHILMHLSSTDVLVCARVFASISSF